MNPPPYHTGIENKGVDTLKDADEMIKSNFGGHGVVPGSYGAPIPNAPMDPHAPSASNSNSANGGSVNSQDSLWNVKGAPAMQSQDPAMMHMMNAYQMQTQGYNVYDVIAMQQQQQQQHPG